MNQDKLESVLNSGSFIEKEEYEDKFGSNGRTSDYIPFLKEAEDLEPDQIMCYDNPVSDSFVSGVRNQVYKLNDDDSEPSEREYNVEATKEKDPSGNDVTDKEGKKLYTFCIRRKDK
jgi:hypothetical protein